MIRIVNMIKMMPALALLMLAFTAQADQAESEAMIDAAGLCSSVAPPEATYLRQLRIDALTVRKALCVGSGSQEEVFRAFIDFLVANRDQWFSDYGQFAEGSDPLDIVLEEAMASESISSYRPFAAGLSAEDTLTIDGRALVPQSTSGCADTECGAIYDEFITFYTYAQNTIASPGAQVVANVLAGLSTQWTRYLEESRSQTLLELAVNSRNYQRSNSAAFGPPPTSQIILLHPGIVIENVENAVDGQKTEEALIIEVIGINFWRQRRTFFPTGGSIAAVYSDRAGVDDVGIGVSVHLGNLYTIGYSNRDGEHGVYISMDLLKPLQDRVALLDRFTQ